MRWSPQQEIALRRVAEFMADPSRQVFYLAGYAGTGKTTLAKVFSEGVEGLVLFGAFTGKAAYVLRQKGCEGATTLHSLIYISQQQSKAKLRELEERLAATLLDLEDEQADNDDFDAEDDPVVRNIRAALAEENKNLSRPFFALNPDSPLRDANLLVVDEVSMVDQQMGEDLISFGIKILVLGDPGQLPPVFGAGYFTSREPDFLLTEIHRQAADNPILHLATRVRLGQSISLGTYGESRIIRQDQLDIADVLACDQMLVGRNETRRDSNVKLRKLQLPKDEPYNVYPLPGDRVVCLRNNHELGLLNGAIWNVISAGKPIDDCIGLNIEPEGGGERQYVTSHTHYFEKRGDKLAWYDKASAQEFDYGYALTVHKSQGSQWNNVLLFDESMAFREYRNKWLYTGLTRAAEKITLVRMS